MVGLLSLLGIVGSPALTATEIDAQDCRQFRIPAQNAATAINSLARQTGVKVLYSYDLASSRQAQALDGCYTADKALQLLLVGSGLTSVLSDEGVITVTSLDHSDSDFEERKHMDNSKKRGFLAALLSAFAANSVGLSPQTLAQDNGGGLVLEEIIVTATRRGETRLLETPLAISAFGGDWLEDRGYNGLADFIQMTPSVTIVETVPGLNNIQMRGISPGVGENNIGFYLDEVPLAYINQSFLPDLRSFDLQRVEMLRGPQTTLYGAGALGGVVRTVTRDPALDEFQLKADVSAGSITDGGEVYEGNVAVNVPLVEDRLALRAVYMQEDRDGWIDQTVLGKDDYNASDTENYRIKLLGQVTDELSVSAMYWGSEIEAFSTNEALEDRTNTEAGETDSTFEYDIYNLTLRYENDRFGVVSSTSQSELKTFLRSDFLFGFTLDTILDPETLTQEIRVYSTHEGPWQWSGGVFYRDAEQTQFQTSDLLPLLGLDPVIQFDTVEAWSGFGEVTGTFLDGKLDITIGGRYLEEDRSSEQRVRPTPPFENSFDEFTPKFDVTYRPADNWMVFFNYGEGFRSGINQFAISLETAALFGVELPTAAQPESADSYEVGIKGTFFDDRLSVDLVAFQLVWQDLQVLVPIISGVLVGAVNASEATSPGYELALNWVASEDLDFGFNLSWNDAKIDEDVTVNATALDPATGLPLPNPVPVAVLFKDDRINNVPEWNASATADYRRSVSGDMMLSANLTVQHVSDREFRSFGNPAFGDSLTTVDARVGLARGNWAVYLFGNNLFDEDGIIQPDATFIANSGTRYQPRTVGINLKFDY